MTLATDLAVSLHANCITIQIEVDIAFLQCLYFCVMFTVQQALGNIFRGQTEKHDIES